ncbi:MAG: hypothetical protein L0212_03885 [Acidobacteria bacterium]|nr:hypothetical protein [Acidobacteriota bacterium]
MRNRLLIVAAALALLGAACGKSAEEAELERLRAENERLRQQTGAAAPATASRVARHFSNDASAGTLAGLMPGYDLAVARERFGREARTRSWPSEGRTITQYEWDLEDGVILRVNSEENGRVLRVAAVMTNPAGVNIPTLYTTTIGRDTFASLQQRWGSALTADPQIWGADGLYTVVQRLQFEGGGQQLEFAYEMPPEMSRAQLTRIGDELMNSRDPAVVMPYLRDKQPFMVALEAVR